MTNKLNLVGLHVYYKMIHSPYNVRLIAISFFCLVYYQRFIMELEIMLEVKNYPFPPFSLVMPMLKVIEFRALREIPDSGSGVLFWPINLSFSFEVTIEAGNNKLRLLR